MKVPSGLGDQGTQGDHDENMFCTSRAFPVLPSPSTFSPPGLLCAKAGTGLALSASQFYPLYQAYFAPCHFC